MRLTDLSPPYNLVRVRLKPGASVWAPRNYTEGALQPVVYREEAVFEIDERLLSYRTMEPADASDGRTSALLEARREASQRAARERAERARLRADPDAAAKATGAAIAEALAAHAAPPTRRRRNKELVEVADVEQHSDRE
ncbi:MAG: hypothetical protein AAFR28_14215 [Pseudomonadota bacterium]